MDQLHLRITPGLALRSENIPFAFPAHLGNPASPSRQLLSRLTVPGMLTKLLRQLEKQNRRDGGFLNPTGGDAAFYLDCLRDPSRRKAVLLLFCVSPADYRSDEHLARVLAVVAMFCSLLKMCDAEFNERFDQFRQERRKALTLHALHELGQDFEQDAGRYIYMSVAHQKEADELRDPTRSVDNIVRYIGWSLEQNFSLRASRLVAELVTCALGLRAKKTERQARHLCGW
jgi:hypothetical protein